MKKNLAVLAAWSALLLAAGPPSAHAFPNEPIGFRGLAWGRDISGEPGMICKGWQCAELRSVPSFKEDLDYRVYEREKEDLRLGAVPLLAIKYFTWKEKFRGAVVTASLREWGHLLEILKGRFGKGVVMKSADARAANTVSWNGADTTISLVDTRVAAEIIFVSTKIAAEERRARREESVRRLRESELMDNNAITKGEGF